MQKINFDELKEKQSYIVEKPYSPTPTKRKNPLNDFDEHLEFRRADLITIVKIEFPFFVVKADNYSGKTLVKLLPEYDYYLPSKAFVKALKNNCNEDY